MRTQRPYPTAIHTHTHTGTPGTGGDYQPAAATETAELTGAELENPPNSPSSPPIPPPPEAPPPPPPSNDKRMSQQINYVIEFVSHLLWAAAFWKTAWETLFSASPENVGLQILSVFLRVMFSSARELLTAIERGPSVP